MAISHAGHNHPATPAGRRACRAGKPTLNATTGVLDMGTAPVVSPRMMTADELGLDMRASVTRAPKPNLVIRTPETCTINAKHCENCGSTNPEDIDFTEDGYTGCCNELISWSRTECRNHHGR